MIRVRIQRGWQTLQRPEIAIFALGLLAFVVESAFRSPVAADMRRITVPADLPIDIGASNPPDDESVSRWVRSEVLYREALRLGLDHQDIIIKRRLVQKMEYLLDGMTPYPDVEEAALHGYYQAHHERYRQPVGVAFRHIFFSNQSGIETAEDNARNALAGLAAGVDPDLLGEPYPGADRFSITPLDRIAGLFGAAFADTLAGLPVGSWQGPLRSPHGMHLVRVTAMNAAKVPDFQTVLTEVRDDYVTAVREREHARQYDAIEARYDIVRQ